MMTGVLHRCKNVQIKTKNVKKRKNVTKIKKSYEKVIKNITSS